ncbi:MAG: hypothetical protein GY863_22290 [bacterium]|nr:hypothetical protein [bacterium]
MAIYNFRPEKLPCLSEIVNPFSLIKVKYISLVFAVLLFLVSNPAFSQLIKPSHIDLVPTTGRLQSNGISAIVSSGIRIWFGTGRGLSMSPDSGSTFINFNGHPDIGKGGISAITLNNDTIWVATGYDTLVQKGGEWEHLDAGGGISWTADYGTTWHHIKQPVDPNNADSLEYEPTTTNVQNVTYDLAHHNGTIWIASWGGGLRRSDDMGNKWYVVTPDGLPFDVLPNNKHKAFSVISADNGLWVGTAGGIFKSIDNGETWTNYNAQNGSGISGNFITSLAEQKINGQSIIWASTWSTNDPNEYYAVSRSANNGLTWEVMLEDEKAHNFAFNDYDVFVVTDNGLFKSVDNGNSWGKFPWIYDEDGEQIMTTQYYDVMYQNGLILVGTNDGLASSTNFGNNWNIFRAFQTPGEDGEPEVYAYPNPFSPSRQNTLGSDGHIRFQYRTESNTEITITVYDYAMNLVRNVTRNKPRSANGDYAETWNGKNEWGRIVANGVYFYKFEKKGEGVFWGKIIIIN